MRNKRNIINQMRTLARPVSLCKVFNVIEKALKVLLLFRTNSNSRRRHVNYIYRKMTIKSC